MGQQFQSALVGALWGYGQSGSSLSIPLTYWSELPISPADIADPLLKQATSAPLDFIVALLPMLLVYSDDEAALRRRLRQIGDKTTATAVAAEGTLALRRLVGAAIARKPLKLAIALPPETKSSCLFPYLSTALAYEESGAGAIQVRNALEKVVGEPPSNSAAQAATAFTLALYSALRTPDFPELVGRSLLPLLTPNVAGAAAAIAGYLCGLVQGPSEMSLERYQMLSACLPAGSPRVSSATINQLAQQLHAAWGGAIPARLGPAAIAMFNT
ncbi:MAG: hypothetical protein ACFB4J_01395 [Elainellaceae cyanobacterium]